MRKELDLDLYKEFMKGTTTIGLICSDGVVVGADSRATMDTFIASTEARKVWKIDENVAMTIAGGVGDAEALIRIIKAQNEIYKMDERKPLSPKSATSLLSIILQDNKMMPGPLSNIVAGMDGTKPELYNLDPLGGYTVESKFTATGSGSITALGYLENVYAEDLSIKDGIKIVHKALTTAMKRDSATGNNILVAAITKSGYTEYADKDLEKAIASK
ncbi:proteasome subunit beta [Candidatus Marsarchaeota archaeon]|nr:proteasome subunit beta [Candidatus Marsarchaeota archaeon]